MIQDTLDIIDSLTHIHTSYDTLESLLVGQNQSSKIEPLAVGLLLKTINNNLKGLIDEVNASRIVAPH